MPAFDDPPPSRQHDAACLPVQRHYARIAFKIQYASTSSTSNKISDSVFACAGLVCSYSFSTFLTRMDVSEHGIRALADAWAPASAVADFSKDGIR